MEGTQIEETQMERDLLSLPKEMLLEIFKKSLLVSFFTDEQLKMQSQLIKQEIGERRDRDIKEKLLGFGVLDPEVLKNCKDFSYNKRDIHYDFFTFYYERKQVKIYDLVALKGEVNFEGKRILVHYGHDIIGSDEILTRLIENMCEIGLSNLKSIYNECKKSGNLNNH